MVLSNKAFLSLDSLEDSMTARLTLGIICGGRSPEHQISLQSARNVIKAAAESFDLQVVGITRAGEWLLLPPVEFSTGYQSPATVQLNTGAGQPVSLVRRQGQAGLLTEAGGFLRLDAVFPVMHGENGEDGTIQGLLQLQGLPYVGCDVAASAICMDKDLAKRLLAAAGIAVAPGVCIQAHEFAACDTAALVRQFGLPLFIKPSRLGSSVGVSKVKEAAQLRGAIAEALRYDNKVLVEATIVGREIECAVLGNETPAGSVAGEVIPRHEFYSYEAKYLDDDGADLKAPADLAPEMHERVQQAACQAYRVLGCAGLARVDFFLTPEGRLILNELNTIPGFTRISMYPKLWELTGVPQPELMRRLVGFALDRHQKQQALLGHQAL